MKASDLEKNPVQSANLKLARLSGPNGYRFEADTVHLHTMLALLDPAAHERSWALQLWACPTVPSLPGNIVGHKVAEVALPPIGELADETEKLEASAFAWPPAIAGEYVMVLALASGRAGRFTDIHDLTIYPRREQFLLPRIKGSVGYRIDGSRVEISVERIENPRAAGNRSGSLSLELWALAEPFNGGPFQGHHLAGAVIGFVGGQSELALQPMELVFTSPPPGDWQIVLMLREWTAAGYVTRDFSSFATRYVVPAPIAARSIAEIEITENATPVSIEEEPLQHAVVTAAQSEPKVVKSDLVSVNVAGVEELASVKGLSRKLAEAMVRKRPFASLDELRKVKGLGPKILEKVRSRLKL